MYKLLCATAVLIIAVASQSIYDCPSSVPRNKYLQIYKGYCFEFVVYREREFEDAENNCRSKGGHLALVKSQDITNFLVDKLLNTYSFGGRVWIGLHDMDSEGRYKWVDNTPVRYSNWPSGSPEQHSLEDCIALDPQTNGDWHDYHCENELFGLINYEKSFICQYNARIRTTIPTTTTTTPSTTTTTPTTTTTTPTTTTTTPTTTKTTPTTTTTTTPSTTTTTTPKPTTTTTTTTSTTTTTTPTTTTTTQRPTTVTTSTTSTTTTTTPKAASTQCPPFVCHLDCGLSGFLRDVDTGCSICECGV